MKGVSGSQCVDEWTRIPGCLIAWLSGCWAGLLSMVWLLFLRYYLMKKERHKNRILSLKENISSDRAASRDVGPVPWMALFKQSGFW